MTDLTADLDTEVRRLRIRIIGLTSRQLAEAIDGDATGEVTETGPSPEPATRREIIVRALAEFSALGSNGRSVPSLGDQSLADQVVVLLNHGAQVAAELPPDERDLLLSRLLRAATDLRRALA
ncbi:hypothetical protein [Brevibacterium sp.]|uniref:hypothetical protein n=1 Tax=Brevibacterium sp. TaxID=1701 RepID=UPI0028114229|nr:hypothetical protein [Brevibacterium sp.]